MSSITVFARPGTGRDAVGWDPWRRHWVIACRAPAIGGKANDALVAFLAEVLDVRRGQVRCVRGARARLKTIEVVGLSAEEIDRRLGARCGSLPSHQGPSGAPRTGPTK